MYDSEENVLLKLKESMRGRKRETESEPVRMCASSKHAPMILVHSSDLSVKQTTEHE